jgi:hypothetical protein
MIQSFIDGLKSLKEGMGFLFTCGLVFCSIGITLDRILSKLGHTVSSDVERGELQGALDNLCRLGDGI